MWRYFSKRGFKRVLNKLPKDIGYNPKLYYWDKASEKGIQMPAMVSIYRDNKGKNLTIPQRTNYFSCDCSPPFFTKEDNCQSFIKTQCLSDHH
ncbi:hypothetical protein [Photorhabdus viridis]